MITALLPTLYRPEGLKRALSSLRKTAPDVYIVVAAELDDNVMGLYTQYSAAWVGCLKPRQGPAYAWNTALKVAPISDIYVLASDDVEYRPGWLENALDVLKNELGGSGLVGFNDGTGKYERTGWVTQYMMTRDFIIEHNGGVAACPWYRVDFTDVEASARAQRAGKFAYSPGSLVAHHWRQIDDEGYREAARHRAEAQKVYEQRRAAGFPDDYQPILTRKELYENAAQPA